MNEAPTLTLLVSVSKMISDFSTSIENCPSSNKTLPLSGSLNVGNFLGPRTASSNRQIRIASTSARVDSNLLLNFKIRKRKSLFQLKYQPFRPTTLATLFVND